MPHRNLLRRRSFLPVTVWEDFDREIERLFGARKGDMASTETCDWLPAIDIKDEPDKYLISADIPGVESKDIDINLENDVLTIKGHKESEVKEEAEGYVRMERARGSFSRSFRLPDADVEKINAKYVNGVLKVTVPKAQKHTGRKIKVEE